MGLRSTLAVAALVAFAATAAPAAQRATASPKTPDHLVGVWQLNLAKSRYFPGPAPTSETRTYTREGDSVVGVIRRMFPDGRSDRIEYTANFDREYPVMGTEDYDHVVLKRIDEYTSEAVLSHAGRVYGIARRVIAVRRPHDDHHLQARESVGPVGLQRRVLRPHCHDAGRAAVSGVAADSPAARLAAVARRRIGRCRSGCGYPTPGTPRLPDGKPISRHPRRAPPTAVRI